MSKFRFDEILRKRMVRWISATHNEHELTAACAQANDVIGKLRSKVPPCVLAAVLKAWLNGWCTARRFPESGHCALSTACAGEDSLEHYAVCSFGWRCMPTRAGLAHHPQTIKRFLLLELSGDDNLVMLACNVFAVMGVVNLMHAQRRRASSSELQGLLWERWRKAADHSAHVRRLLR